MLSYRYAPSRITYPVYIQPKLTGIRALYQIGHFQTAWDDLPPLKHLTEPLSKIFDDSIILDGVLTNIEDDPDLIEDPDLAEYHVFDVVNFHRSFESRFMAPASILTDTQHLHKARVVETHRVLSAKPLTYFYDKWTTNGYDGLIYRLHGCPYICDKSKNLLHQK